MRSSSDYRVVVGIAFILFGGLLLLQSLGVLEVGGLIWAGVFVALGAGFWVAMVQDRSRWWAVIPGTVLLGLGALVALGELLPAAAQSFGGPLFLGSISLAFWIVYLIRSDFWWAIIPGGTLATLAIVSGIADNIGGMDTGGVFFLGLAVTFLVLFFLPESRGRQTWAIFPAAVLGVMGLGFGLFSGSTARLIWPAVLILLGLFFIARAAMRRQTP